MTKSESCPTAPEFYSPLRIVDLNLIVKTNYPR